MNRVRTMNVAFPVATPSRASLARKMMAWGVVPVLCQMTRVLVSKLTATQPRICGPYVSKLVVEATDLPAIQVARLGGRYVIVDGHHRAMAALRRGERHIRAVVGEQCPPHAKETP